MIGGWMIAVPQAQRHAWRDGPVTWELPLYQAVRLGWIAIDYEAGMPGAVRQPVGHEDLVLAHVRSRRAQRARDLMWPRARRRRLIGAPLVGWGVDAEDAARLAIHSGCRTVTIPARAEHEGMRARVVTLSWICPKCGGPRGLPYAGFSYDGSRRLAVHRWENDCGHVDDYASVRAEADAAARLEVAYG